MTNPTPNVTDFTRDVMGRYVCNGLDEALRSTDTWQRPDARPFDIVILGAGAAGGAAAQHFFANDLSHRHRILVLEAGPFLLPEHLQNLPLSGLNIYGPPSTSIQELRQQGNFGLDHPRDEVWGLPWHSATPFPGLAYAIGGRSLAWGGWSPTLLQEEMDGSAGANHRWPEIVIKELLGRYYQEARDQMGVSQSNDFIHGELHEALRQVLYEGIRDGKVPGAIPFRDLPLYLDNVPTRGRNLYRLEAPLAVETRTRAGFFPTNKFSSVPLLMKAARSAFLESNYDDVKKRLMVVPQCHVIRLVTQQEGRGQQRVIGVETNQGYVPLPPWANVVMAMGTIESTRLAQVSFPAISNYHLLGQNLMGDMISLLMIRVPRTSLPVDATIKELQASALIVAGREQMADASTGHFHVQIVASGLGPWDFNAEAEFFQKVPDIDSLRYFKYANDTHAVIGILGVAKMEPQNPNSYITLDPERDEFGQQRAFVAIDPSPNDLALWEAMDRASDDVAKVFANGQPYEVITWTGIYPVQGAQAPAEVLPYEYRHFGLGDSHHEAGTLWMGEDPLGSVCNTNGRFHYVQNAYVASPAAFPTNAAPVLTSVALGRRLADHLVPPPTPYVPGDGFIPLFDGIAPYLWQMVGSGNFTVVDGALESIPGDDLGLYWCTQPLPTDFILRLEWLRWAHDDNSGIFLRFPDPHSKGYMNPAYVGVDFGFEVQIDETGAPDGAAFHKTGAIYGQRGQRLSLRPARPAGEWNDFEIRVQGQRYTVFLNGHQVTHFENWDMRRGLPSTPKAPAFLGIQTYPQSRLAFRNIRIAELPTDVPM